MNYNKLKGRIIEITGSVPEFAKLMGLTKQSIYYKLNNSSWDQEDILKACKILNISNKDIPVYFFNLS